MGTEASATGPRDDLPRGRATTGSSGEPGLLASLPNLKLILSLGAGIDHILCDPHLPRGVPLVRLVDPYMTHAMSEYVVLQVLRLHRHEPGSLTRSARYLHRRTGGMIGSLSHLVRAAAQMAILEGEEAITWLRRLELAPP